MMRIHRGRTPYKRCHFDFAAFSPAVSPAQKRVWKSLREAEIKLLVPTTWVAMMTTLLSFIALVFLFSLAADELAIMCYTNATTSPAQLSGRGVDGESERSEELNHTQAVDRAVKWIGAFSASLDDTVHYLTVPDSSEARLACADYARLGMAELSVGHSDMHGGVSMEEGEDWQLEGHVCEEVASCVFDMKMALLKLRHRLVFQGMISSGVMAFAILSADVQRAALKVGLYVLNVGVAAVLLFHATFGAMGPFEWARMGAVKGVMMSGSTIAMMRILERLVSISKDAMIAEQERIEQEKTDSLRKENTMAVRTSQRLASMVPVVRQSTRRPLAKSLSLLALLRRRLEKEKTRHGTRHTYEGELKRVDDTVKALVGSSSKFEALFEPGVRVYNACVVPLSKHEKRDFYPCLLLREEVKRVATRTTSVADMSCIPEYTCVESYPYRIRVILHEVLSNAIKYGSSDITIQLSFKRVKNKSGQSNSSEGRGMSSALLCFCCIDHGNGIPSAVIEDLEDHIQALNKTEEKRGTTLSSIRSTSSTDEPCMHASRHTRDEEEAKKVERKVNRDVDTKFGQGKHATFADMREGEEWVRPSRLNDDGHKDCVPTLGLGLPSVYHVANMLGGYVKVSSNARVGTMCEVYIPVKVKAGQKPGNEGEEVQEGKQERGGREGRRQKGKEGWEGRRRIPPSRSESTQSSGGMSGLLLPDRDESGRREMRTWARMRKNGSHPSSSPRSSVLSLPHITFHSPIPSPPLPLSLPTQSGDEVEMGEKVAERRGKVKRQVVIWSDRYCFTRSIMQCYSTRNGQGHGYGQGKEWKWMSEEGTVHARVQQSGHAPHCAEIEVNAVREDRSFHPHSSLPLPAQLDAEPLSTCDGVFLFNPFMCATCSLFLARLKLVEVFPYQVGREVWHEYEERLAHVQHRLPHHIDNCPFAVRRREGEEEGEGGEEKRGVRKAAKKEEEGRDEERSETGNENAGTPALHNGDDVVLLIDWQCPLFHSLFDVASSPDMYSAGMGVSLAEDEACDEGEEKEEEGGQDNPVSMHESGKEGGGDGSDGEEEEEEEEEGRSREWESRETRWKKKRSGRGPAGKSGNSSSGHAVKCMHLFLSVCADVMREIKTGANMEKSKSKRDGQCEVGAEQKEGEGRGTKWNENQGSRIGGERIGRGVVRDGEGHSRDALNSTPS
eukprot:CAMPEP_0113870776 /NCGR_PEP_ID=MMETSP0780_2-20120614/2273_1 /TAXON_ID=652834 /ORGANISM="Palpitomonas bilix" /LENGTH=1180 /DNA_ID=CAMNT_0000856089 /DNA_START=373 /DNA_END=3911 /DNA_ORIENTATION=- /assembly_acc=CAM_ASM_000599